MTADVASTRCYIDEYMNQEGRRSARLRQKHTAKKVDMGFTDAASRRDFLRFLGGAKHHQNDVPGLFEKDDDEDCVIVPGDLDFEVPDEIRYVPNDRLSYYIA